MKRIGIGYEYYKEFVDKNLYFVDKTLLIRDIVKQGGKVTLFTRPRRFGKTLALSMLRTFFEQEYDRDGNLVDNRRYFEGKKIMEAGDDILSMMGRYPVIKLTLKSAKQPNFYTAIKVLFRDIITEFRRHDYLLKSDRLTDEEKTAFRKVLRWEVEWDERTGMLSFAESKVELEKELDGFATVINTLSQLLSQHHGKNVIILLDEYDVPLENAYYAGFYDKMVGFIRSLFESSLKTNDCLERAVVTGCLRISRESIFTGMNNLNIVSVRTEDFAEGFGFTQEETEEALRYFGLSEKVEEVREWYDGYLFGETEIYNPWSVTKYIQAHIANINAFPEPYWSNTSSNSIIRDLVDHADSKAKEELDRLIGGGTVEKKIHEDITYGDIYESEDNLWNFLFFTGYMKKVSERRENEDIYVTMCIPNAEIRSIYRNQISNWFDIVVKKEDRSSLYKAIVEKDCKGIRDYLNGVLRKSISTFDSAESFYHGFFLSLLYDMADYSVKSNREEGEGRPDVVMYPEDYFSDPAYLFELKARRNIKEVRPALEEAVAQIRERHYEEGILDDGYIGVVSYAICFCKKSCMVSVL